MSCPCARCTPDVLYLKDVKTMTKSHRVTTKGCRINRCAKYKYQMFMSYNCSGYKYHVSVEMTESPGD